MKISFEQTLQDYPDFCYYHYKQQKSGKKTILNVFLIINTLCLIGLLYFLFMGGSSTDLIAILFVAAYIVYNIASRSKWGFRKRVERYLKSGKNPDMTGERTLIFEEEQLKVITPNSETNIKWKSGFEYLREAPKQLLLYTAVNQAILIPKRIFLLDQKLFEVKSFIASRLSSARADG